jgi:hypothetical protein
MIPGRFLFLIRSREVPGRAELNCLGVIRPSTNWRHTSVIIVQKNGHISS